MVLIQQYISTLLYKQGIKLQFMKMSSYSCFIYVLGDCTETTTATFSTAFPDNKITFFGEHIQVQLKGNSHINSLDSLFYKKAVGVMVVYDVSSYKSFQNAKRWVHKIRSFNGSHDVSILLVGDGSNQASGRNVIEEAQTFAVRNHLHLLDISSKETREVAAAFELVASDVYSKISSDLELELDPDFQSEQALHDSQFHSLEKDSKYDLSDNNYESGDSVDV